MRSACDTVVRTRVPRATKEKAVEALDRMGLTLSDAMRLTLIHIGESGALPFSVGVPNARTAAAILELESGGGTRHKNPDAMFDDLGL